MIFEIYKYIDNYNEKGISVIIPLVSEYYRITLCKVGESREIYKELIIIQLSKEKVQHNLLVENAFTEEKVYNGLIVENRLLCYALYKIKMFLNLSQQDLKKKAITSNLMALELNNWC